MHVLPQDFIVGGQDGISVASGLTIKSPLRENVHVVTAGTSLKNDLIACANAARMRVVTTAAGLLAASEALLMPNEKELGVALVDIGAGSTDIAIFERGRLGTLVPARSAARSYATSWQKFSK